MMDSRTRILLRTKTDKTGHVDVSVIAVFDGEGADARARKESERLNHTTRESNMEVYIVRIVGEELGDET